MPRTKNVPRRNEGGATSDPQPDAIAPTAVPVPAPAPAPTPHHDTLQVVGGEARATGVTIKEEEEGEEEEEEEIPEGQRRDLAPAPGPGAQVPASGPPPARAAEPAPAPHYGTPSSGGEGPGASPAVGSGVKMEEGAQETLAQQRDRLALAWAHGPVRVDSHIKVEDSSSGEDTDGEGEGEEEDRPGREGGDGEGGGQGLGGEGGMELLAAHVPEDDGGYGGAPSRSNPAGRAARAKRGRGDVASADDVPDAPAPKRRHGGVHVGPSGRHGVDELDDEHIKKATPWLRWRARLSLHRHKDVQLGFFSTVDDAARAYDAEVPAARVVARAAAQLPATGGAADVRAGRNT